MEVNPPDSDTWPMQSGDHERVNRGLPLLGPAHQRPALREEPGEGSRRDGQHGIDGGPRRGGASTLALITPEDAPWRRHALEHAVTPLQHPEWLDVIRKAYRLRARVAVLNGPDGAISAALPMIASKLPWRTHWTALPSQTCSRRWPAAPGARRSS